MRQADDKILGALLDSYEKSKLSRHENVNRINVSYDFNKKNIPQYFDESSLAADDINEQMMELQRQGLISIKWKNNRVGNIIEKVVLCDAENDRIYKRLNRIPKEDQEEAVVKLLEVLELEMCNEAVCRFICYIKERIQQGKSVKEYVDIADLASVELLVRSVFWVMQNEKESYIREFSIEHFHDSKTFESMISKICKVIRWVNEEFADYESEEILEEYNIFKNPGYVYVKGNARLVNKDGESFDISSFPDGIGFALGAHQADEVAVVPDADTKEVYTIENLTSFYRFAKKDSLVIYLGGYHNGDRRRLLNDIYEKLPEASYYHFGDIDVGGFQIYYHLKDKTGIPFHTYLMDVDTLKKYKEYAKPLTENDAKRLRKIMESRMSDSERMLAEYMLEKKIKLEQECVRAED